MIIQYRFTGILLFLLTVLSVTVSVGQSDLGKIKCICIDAGHGGKDPGALGTKAYEKNVVLSVALKLGKMIENACPDIKVIYIRDKDVFVELRERTRIANSNKADLFISIHANALDLKKKPQNKYIKGIETYVLGSNNSEHNLQVAMKENSVIHYEDDYSLKYEGFDPSRAESYIMFNMLRNMHLEKSLTIASMIQKELVAETQHVDRDVRQSPLWVLKDVAMPATLVEIGYISNLEEEYYMMSAVGQDKIAKAIFKGFKNYKAKMEKHVAVQPENDMAETIPAKKVVAEKPETAEKTKTEVGGDLVYAVQVASATARIKNHSGLCSGEKVAELNTGGRFRYYVAQAENLEEVKGNLKRIKNKVRDCFIIAIYKGRLISLAEAKELEKNKN